jgi:tetratricopeptide (TPR) repeat protein
MHVVLAATGRMQDPVGWTSKDIGDVGTQGSARYSEDSTTWIVRGSGSDIFGAADSFQYVCRRLQGDGSIIAKVESIGKTHPWAKGGVMIRESLEPGSRFAGVYSTPDYGVCFQARTDTASNALADAAFSSREQNALRTPVWIKLERKGNQFRGYYATDGGGTVWTSMAWKPQNVLMARTVYIGLAVTSHVKGQACEAKFGGVAVSGMEGGIPDAELSANPGQALVKAYQELEQLGNWRENAATLEKNGNLIAGSLFAIARARVLTGEPTSTVLPDYYRITRVLPDSSFAVDALTQIAIFDGSKGLQYALKRIHTKSKEDQNRFYVAAMEGCFNAPEIPAREALIGSFAEYVGKSTSFTLLDEAMAGLKSDEQAASVCKSLIQHSMNQPSNGKTAVVALRYAALKSRIRQEDNRIRELARWAATKYKDAKLTACAMAILADTHYAGGQYVEAVEVFQPGLFSRSRTEPKTVESIENTLTYYRANTLLQDTIDQERIYQGLTEKASGLEMNIVALHCQRKIAAIRGLSLERFEKSAQKGMKYCESGPENEIWFWKGFIAAEEGDLGKAAAAQERFVQADGKSVLAARAYYDIARAKMAIGEDAKQWVAKAKALSPCDVVTELENRLNTQVSPRDQK